MLVGDAKQAIYRWRGGDAEQFVNLYNKTTQPFPVVQNILNLSNNFRSAKAIVDFNNGFFKFLSQNYFHNEDYILLFYTKLFFHLTLSSLLYKFFFII